MADDKKDEIRKLKKDFIELIESRREERELMVEVISSLNLLAIGKDDISEGIKKIREMITPEDDLEFDNIRSLNRELKDKLIARERDCGAEEVTELELLSDKYIESCRTMKRIMAAILEDFYPLSDEMQQDADMIKVECKGNPLEIDTKKPSKELLEFIDKIKIQISGDFNEINSTFSNLLGQVKELEKSLAIDFGGETSIKEIESFENNINLQVGNITESFESYHTIKEIKNVVFEKLVNIKGLVSLKKKEEVKKTKTAQENMKKLNQRINAVEKKAQKMSVKAKEYQKAALKDSLTGLFSRGAFDAKIKESLENYTTSKKEFSLIVFDVNKFKKINDTLGHIAGDKVLIKISECLEESFRKDDFIARYGGDEFVVIIENISKEMAMERIELFNKNLKKRRFVSKKHGEINLSVSAGTTTVIDKDTVETIIDRADKAMYDTKQKRGK